MTNLSVVGNNFLPQFIAKHSYLCTAVNGFECKQYHEKIKSYGLEVLVIRRYNVCNRTDIDNITKSKLIKELDKTIKIILKQ